MKESTEISKNLNGRSTVPLFSNELCERASIKRFSIHEFSSTEFDWAHASFCKFSEKQTVLTP